MRPKEFLELVSGYDCSKVSILTEEKRLNGGWEVWLQVEIAGYLLYIKNQGADMCIERERFYPNTQMRCDFYISYLRSRDETYIELKCQNACAQHPLADITNRFSNDIIKQKDPKICDCPGFCLAVVRCSCDDVKWFRAELHNRIGYWTSCYVLNWENRKIYDLNKRDEQAKLEKDMAGVNKATFLFAVSP